MEGMIVPRAEDVDIFYLNQLRRDGKKSLRRKLIYEIAQQRKKDWDNVKKILDKQSVDNSRLKIKIKELGG